MRIVVDRGRCTSIGLCEATAPDLFEIRADGALHAFEGDIPEDRRVDLEQACENCPTQALSISD